MALSKADCAGSTTSELHVRPQASGHRVKVDDLDAVGAELSTMAPPIPRHVGRRRSEAFQAGAGISGCFRVQVELAHPSLRPEWPYGEGSRDQYLRQRQSSHTLLWCCQRYTNSYIAPCNEDAP